MLTRSEFSRRYLTRALVEHRTGLANLLREMRVRSGLSQHALANIMGTTNAQISRWETPPKGERDDHGLALASFVRYAHACGHQVYLRFGDESVVANNRDMEASLDRQKPPTRPLGV